MNVPSKASSRERQHQIWFMSPLMIWLSYSEKGCF